jgi:hypothetical protein
MITANWTTKAPLFTSLSHEADGTGPPPFHCEPPGFSFVRTDARLTFFAHNDDLARVPSC